MTAVLGIATLETGVDLKGLDAGLKQGEQHTKGFLAEVKTGFARSVGGAALSAGKVAAGAIVNFAKEASAEFQQFETNISEVFTLMPDMSAAAMSQMEADVLAFGVSVGRQTDETIPALYQAISSGVPSDNVFDFLQVASDAALGGVTDLETAVDGITSVTNAYGTEVLSAAEASDVMFTTVRLGKTNFEQLSSSLFNVIPTASALGVSFEDVSANLAAITLQGTPTSVATTQLRAAFVEASKGGTALSDAIKDLTGKSFTDLIASGQTSSEIFDNLRSSMPEQEFKDLFGSVEALNAVLGITGPNAVTVDNAFNQMQESAGATAAAADTMSQSYGHLQEETLAAKEQVMILIGEGLIPGQAAAMAFTRDTLLLAGSLLSLNKAADDASESIVELVESGIDADINAAKLLDTWTNLDDFWGRSAFGRGKLQDDMQRVVIASVDLEGSFSDVEDRLQELDPAFEVATNGMVLLDGTGVGLISTMQALQQAERFEADTLAAASIQRAGVNTAITDTTTAAEAATIATIDLATAVEGSTVIAADFGAQYEANTAIANDYNEASLAYELTAGQVEEAERARALAHKEAEAAQIAADEAAKAHTATMGGYFNAALTATGQTDSLEMQLYEAGTAAGLGAEHLAIIAAATGEFSAAEIEAAFQAALMSENINNLVTAVSAGDITAREATEALQLLKEGEVETAAEAIQLQDDMERANGSLQNARQAAMDAALALDAIPNSVDVVVNYSATGSIDPPPSGHSGGVPGGSGYAYGGWTGSGAANDIAGVVHRQELVVPADVLRSGAAGILDFANRNVPGGVGGSTDNSRKVTMVNPKFYGVENMPNFLEQLEALIPA